MMGAAGDQEDDDRNRKWHKARIAEDGRKSQAGRETRAGRKTTCHKQRQRQV